MTAERPPSGPPEGDPTARIQALWDELAEFETSRHDEALTHLLETLCALVGAQNANWFAAVRLPDVPGDPIHGWRPRFLRFLKPSAALASAVSEQTHRLERPGVDPTIIANVAQAGRLRANRLVDLVPPEWFDGPYYRDFYLGVGHVDTIWAGCPVNADAEVYFGLHRAVGEARFTTAERELVVAALRGLRWFHRQYLLSHGLLVGSAPLTPTEREVLRGLLAGHSEKEVAALQGRRTHTVHEYVKVIYRKFGVRSRPALMALWLGTSG